MTTDRYGKILVVGHRVYNTYYREYGIVTGITYSGIFGFVKVKYLKREELSSPLELEISIVQPDKDKL